jgi:hypothetical protein
MLSHKTARYVDLVIWNGLIFAHNNFRISIFRNVRNSEEDPKEPVYFYKKALMLTNKKDSGKMNFQRVNHGLFFMSDKAGKFSVSKLKLSSLIGYQSNQQNLAELFEKLSHSSVLDIEVEPVDFIVVQDLLLIQLRFSVRVYNLPTRNLDVNRKPLYKFVLPKHTDQEPNLRSWFAQSRDQVINMVCTYRYVLINTQARLILVSLRKLQYIAELREPEDPLFYQILKSIIIRKCHFWLGAHQTAVDIFTNTDDKLLKVVSQSLRNNFEQNILLHHVYFHPKNRELIVTGSEGYMRQARLHLGITNYKLP